MIENHCKDCCCAQSWQALEITEYTGKSIPEHIEALVARNSQLAEALRKLANETQGFVSMADPVNHGYTNIAVINERLTETRAILVEVVTP